MNIDGYRKQLGHDRVPAHVPLDQASRSRNFDVETRGFLDDYRSRPSFGQGGHGGDFVTLQSGNSSRDRRLGTRIWYAIAARETAHTNLLDALDALASLLREHLRSGDWRLPAMPRIDSALDDLVRYFAGELPDHDVALLAQRERAAASLGDGVERAAITADGAATALVQTVDAAMEAPSAETFRGALTAIEDLRAKRAEEAASLGMVAAPPTPSAVPVGRIPAKNKRPCIEQRAPVAKLDRLPCVVNWYRGRAEGVPNSVAALAQDLDAMGFLKQARYWRARADTDRVAATMLKKASEEHGVKAVLGFAAAKKCSGTPIDWMQPDIFSALTTHLPAQLDLSSMLVLARLNSPWRRYLLAHTSPGTQKLRDLGKITLRLPEPDEQQSGHQLARYLLRTLRGQSNLRLGNTDELRVTLRMPVCRRAYNIFMRMNPDYAVRSEGNSESLDVIAMRTNAVSTRVRLTHEADLSLLRFSPDNRQALLPILGVDGVISFHLVDLASGGCTRFGSDLAEFDWDGTIHAVRWDDNGLPHRYTYDPRLHQLQRHDTATQQLTMPTGYASLSYVYNDETKVWRLVNAQGETLPLGEVQPNSAFLTVSSNAEWIVAQDIDNGRRLDIFAVNDPAFHQSICSPSPPVFAFSADSRILATGTPEYLTLYSLDSGEQLSHVSWIRRPRPSSLCFASHHDALDVGGSDGSIRRVAFAHD